MPPGLGAYGKHENGLTHAIIRDDSFNGLTSQDNIK